jgi:hypothetical protein
MRLVTDWKSLSKLWSVQLSVGGFVASSIAMALAATGAIVPWFAVLKPWECFGMAAIVFFGVFLGRIIKQGKDDANPDA